MYLDFYQLKKAPFHITPDPEFLFLSPSHKTALGIIIQGMEERYGFVSIVGEVGVGKTTIVRAYLERADQQQYKTIYMVNADVSFRALLQSILREFGVDLEKDEPFDMINRLHHILLEEYAQGRKVALIIDEAQNMPVETLEQLRMLSNLETPTEKLLQIVFVGQPEFKHKLDLKELRHLKQRVVLRVTIVPLTAEESLAYIRHRLAKVAMTLEPVFTPRAIKRIVAAAQGTPRILNTLCMNALIAGFGYRQKPITASTVREVITLQDEARKPSRLRRGLAWALAFIACAGVVVLAQEKLKDAGSTVVTYFSKPQQMLTEPQRSASESGLATNTVKDTPWENRVTTALNGTNLHEGKGQTEQRDSKSDVMQENVKSTNLTAKTQQDGDIKKYPQAVPNTKGAEDPLLVTVKKGDSIAKIALEIYGTSNESIFELIKKHNPQVKDLNRIGVGEQLLFPKLQATTE
jgi:general secretion pathway protein A